MKLNQRQQLGRIKGKQNNGRDKALPERTMEEQFTAKCQPASLHLRLLSEGQSLGSRDWKCKLCKTLHREKRDSSCSEGRGGRSCGEQRGIAG